MKQKIITARNLNVGDLLVFPNGEHSLDHLMANMLEKIIAVGIDPQLDTVEVHSQVAGKIFTAKGLPGETVIKVYREE